MDARKIKDAKTLKAWLESRPQSDSIFIAHRIALRNSPFLYVPARFRVSQGFDLAALAVLRCNLTAGVAGIALTLKVKAAASAAARSADAKARLAYSNARSTDTVMRSTVRNAIRVAARSAYTAFATDAADTAALAAASAQDLNYSNDASALQSFINPLTLPLWPNAQSHETSSTAIAAMHTYWQTNNPTHWDFWQRWYDAAIAGRPLDWQLQHDIALIPDAIWQSGPGPVAEAIAKIEAEHKRRILENTLTAELRDLPKPSIAQVAITRAAMEQNRAALPPTFDAIEGLILLEIEHLQQRNYTDDLDQAEARRQIRIFITLYDAICALRAQLPATAPVTEEQAEKSVSLVSLYTKKFADLPLAKADEVVEGFWSAGRSAVQATLIVSTTLLGVSYGLPALAAVTIGTMVFAPKNAADLVKAAREAIAPKP